MVGVMMSGACVECNRLWEEYADAVRSHLKIIGQYQVAVIQQNSSALDALEPLCREAEEKRALAHRAVKDHQAEKHKTPTQD